MMSFEVGSLHIVFLSNAFILQEHVKLIRSKDFYCFKRFIFQINAVLLYFLFITISTKILLFSTLIIMKTFLAANF